MGLYAPIIKGEIEGFKIGLDTDLILYEHARLLEYDKLGGEWLIGFGVGFNKGQNIRKKLIKNTDGDSVILEKRIKAILFLLDETVYSQFEDMLSESLKNISSWESQKLKSNVLVEVRSLIQQDKLQQALMTIKEFYHKQKVLIALMNYSTLEKSLSSLRQRNRRNEINNEVYLLEKKKIKKYLEKWVKNNQA
ncbi:hypothetical protein [Aquimarina rhabdastrellae]